MRHSGLKQPRNFKNKRQNSEESSSDGGAYLALSLFVVLLAFFMVLNGISGYDDVKVVPVIDSVSDVFGSKTKMVEVEPQRAAVLDHAQKSIYKGEFFDRLDALFTSQLNNFKIKRIDTLGTMLIQVKWDDFQKAVREEGQINALDRADVRLLKLFFVPTLVALLQDENDTNPIHMNIVLNIGVNPAELVNTQPQKMKSYMTDLDEIARLFGKQGLDDSLMSVSVGGGVSGVVSVFFTPYSVYHDRDDYTGDEDISGQEIQEIDDTGDALLQTPGTGNAVNDDAVDVDEEL